MDAFKKLFKQPPRPKPRLWHCSSCSRGFFFQNNQAANHLRQSAHCKFNFGMTYKTDGKAVESNSNILRNIQNIKEEREESVARALSYQKDEVQKASPRLGIRNWAPSLIVRVWDDMKAVEEADPELGHRALCRRMEMKYSVP